MRQAELLEDLGRWAWRQWRLTVDLEPGEHEIAVRAWDSSAATQPARPGAALEPQGLLQQRAGEDHPGGRMSDDYTHRTLLANERTYLAWWRTGLTTLTVALAAARVVPVLSEARHQWPYTVVGAAFALLGTACIAYAELRRRAVDRAVRAGRFADPGPATMLASPPPGSSSASRCSC